MPPAARETERSEMMAVSGGLVGFFFGGCRPSTFTTTVSFFLAVAGSADERRQRCVELSWTLTDRAGTGAEKSISD